MPSSNAGNPSAAGTSGTPRIQISLSKEQRKSIAAASVTPAKCLGKAEAGNNNNDDGKETTKASTIEEVISSTPGLYKSVRKALKNQTLNFKINVECTSLKVSPSGNFLWGGFSDGTLRVWDLSGTFGVEDDDVVASRQKTDVLVNSKLTQGYGAVACQIHARGVHTDLITTVDISDDAKYVFVGVARGAMELHAVFVGDLERAVHTQKQRERDGVSSSHGINRRNILDYLKVYCHSDAKLKGFGACAKVLTRTERGNPSPSYVLLTGKGIKNIHIWKFTPPEHHSCDEDDSDGYGNGRERRLSICEPPDDEEDNGIWDQLYDAPTNGNTILLLGFYRNPQNKLLAVSKSDAQKLRLWDLSYEESKNPGEERPKRPPYQDVANSQSALEIAGGIGVCGGGNMYNEMSIVSLDRPDDPFNHTELALPSSASSDPMQAYSSRRQRRGEMKAVVTVATSPRDSSHALLELDDGSLVGYSAGSSSSKDFTGSIPRLAIATPESTGIPALPADFWRRCICLANIAGVVIAASSLYNPNTNKGQLVIRALGGLKKPRGSEVMEKKKQKLLKQQKQRERLERERQKQKEEKQKRESTLPKTPSPIHTNLQSSPLAADAKALQDAVSAPKAVPVSALRSNQNPLDAKGGEIETSKNTADQSSTSASSLTRVSPNGSMETPSHEKNPTNDQDDSPDSTEGLPKISKFLQPKRIDMQSQQLQEKSDKRKIHPTEETKEGAVSKGGLKAVKKARRASIPPKPNVMETPQAIKMSSEKAAASNASESPVGVFQLNSIGSVPFKSPKPQPLKSRKVSAPSKPKKPAALASLPSESFSTPTSGKDSKIKAGNCVAVPMKPSKKSIANISSTAVERKRERATIESDVSFVASKKVARTSDEMSTALLLTALASPKPGAKAKESDEKNAATKKTTTVASQSKTAIKSTTKTRATGDSNRLKLVSPSATVNKISNSASKSKGKSTTIQNTSNVPQTPSREEILHEKVSEQYNQLRAFLKTITDRSMALIHSRNLRGPVPSALSSGARKSTKTHVSAYSKLLTEHRAAHDCLQSRLLRSAETTLRLVLESRITAEEARTELKQTIKKFEEILYDTLHRQEVERLAVVGQYCGTPSNFARGRKIPGLDSKQRLESSKGPLDYPCKEAFNKIEDICAAISRPVGRPRSALAALR